MKLLDKFIKSKISLSNFNRLRLLDSSSRNRNKVDLRGLQRKTQTLYEINLKLDEVKNYGKFRFRVIIKSYLIKADTEVKKLSLASS